MGTHPNTMLLAVLTPNGLTRQTARAIISESGVEEDSDIKIGKEDYHLVIMEGDYDEGFQISAKEGDIVLMDFLTYGYGDTKNWDSVESQKKELEEWCKGICERHQCTYQIKISSNYW